MSALRPNKLSAVCVFCGAQSGQNPVYVAAAKAMGKLLAQSDITVIYGGGHIGMMGALADAALAAGGRVIGVIPEHLMRPEVAHQNLTQLHVVDSMHTRKREMARLADAFAVLPGGFGTFEEMFEMVTWLQLGLQRKPIGVLNVEQFFTPLIKFLSSAADQGFIRASHRDLLTAADSPLGLLQQLQARIE